MGSLAHRFDAAPANVDEFLRLYEGVEGRREFVHGEVVEMMTNVTAAHMRVTLALAAALLDRLSKDHAVAVADFGVETAAGVRFPDVMVSPDRYRGDELKAEAPSLIAEVLSASSAARDFGPKAAEYLALSSLHHYLVLAQDRPTVWHWARYDEGFGEPTVLEGRDAVLTLAAFDATVPLAELYS